MVEIVDHHGRFAMFAADGVVVAEVRQACVGAELSQVGVLFVVMHVVSRHAVKSADARV